MSFLLYAVMRRLHTLGAVVAAVSVVIIIALLDLPYRLQDSKRVSLIGQIEYVFL